MDGIYWIELAPLADPALVPQTVAKALRISEQAGRHSTERIIDAIHDKQLLLVLDNCEHLLSACAQFAEALLSATDVSILSTSREPLSVVGETLYSVAPLPLPTHTVSADDVEDLGQFDAIQLFFL